NKFDFQTVFGAKGENSFVRHISTPPAKIKAIFDKNLATYFPAYRFEKPGYINDVYDVKLEFQFEGAFNGYLTNPIENISGLPSFANWLMDVVLDQQFYPADTSPLIGHLNVLFTQALIGKTPQPVKLGIGPRGAGRTRIQIADAVTNTTIYPSIFGISSGEAALICLFGEIIKQCDKVRFGKKFTEVSGVVLIDEVDKHLHIKLQKESLPKLIDLFPNVQFIVSSH
ncbi:AAA family ATPase, partial [Pseudomonas syringae]|uniref:AAA family ATPase n=1 Tax=Pseudomonas syringae TaxID=317 RepID=UPI0013C36A1D